MLKKLRLLIFVLQLLCISIASAQVVAEKPVVNFNRAIGQQSRLFNGPGYDFYPFLSDTSAYFQNLRTFEKGTVVYDGYAYTDIPILYDLHKDLVVTLSHDSVGKFSLLSERISDFYQNGHHFIRVVKADTSADSPANSGFYELMYDGKVKILLKRYKNIEETTSSMEYKKYFVPGQNYFLLKDQVYYKVNSENAFMAAFGARKKDFQRYLKEKHIKFRKTPELALLTLADYYDHLPN